MNATESTEVVYLSVADERANVVTHAAGILLSLLAFAVLAMHPADPPWSLRLVSLVYAVTMVAVYVCSTMSHAVYNPLLRNRWRARDQGVIYCLISGTYTPFIWTCSPHGWRVPLLIAVWVAAIAGLYAKVFIKHRVNSNSTVTYILLGWLPAIPLFAGTPLISLYWMVAGGLAYTIGVLFLVSDHRAQFLHAVWHLAVIAGSACHFIAIYKLISIFAASNT